MPISIIVSYLLSKVPTKYKLNPQIQLKWYAWISIKVDANIVVKVCPLTDKQWILWTPSPTKSFFSSWTILNQPVI